MKNICAALIVLTAAIVVATSASSASSHRPSVTVLVDDSRIVTATRVPAGYVDMRIVTRGKVHHHLAFWHLNPGVTKAHFIEILKKPNGDPFKLATAVGGNGPMLPGSFEITMRLVPGIVVFADIVDGPTTRIASFRVVDPPVADAPPATVGTVLNRAFRFVLPPGFGRPGVYRFTNVDAVAHDGDIFPLVKGKNARDLVKWLQAGGKGRPPVDLARPLGGPGVIGAHWSSWFTLPKLPRGRYAFVCFLPDDRGVPHAAMGMVSQFAVG
jgi:hypothetical protein